MVRRFEYRSERHSDLDTFEKYLNAMGRVGWQLAHMREELSNFGNVKVRHLVWVREVQEPAPAYPNSGRVGHLPYDGRGFGRGGGGGGGGKYSDPSGYRGHNTYSGRRGAEFDPVVTEHPPQDGDD